MGGVLLNKENISNVSRKSGCPDDLDVQHFQVSLQVASQKSSSFYIVYLLLLQGNFYVFAPKVGDQLDVAVLTVGQHSAIAEGKTERGLEAGQHCNI